MKGKLRREFIKRVRIDLTDDLDSDLIVGTAEDIIYELCDEIEDRLGSILGDMVDIRGITEINYIRNNLQELMDDLW